MSDCSSTYWPIILADQFPVLQVNVRQFLRTCLRLCTKRAYDPNDESKIRSYGSAMSALVICGIVDVLYQRPDVVSF